MKMDIKAILDTLPHRYPFLLVDRVVELEPGQRILAQKNVTANEEFFNGHFPHYKVMPGVLIIEALAQAAGILSFKTIDSQASDEQVYFFAGIDNARFKRPVVPGDVVMLEVFIERPRPRHLEVQRQGHGGWSTSRRGRPDVRPA